MCLCASERNALSDVVLELSRRRKNKSVRRSTLFFRTCFSQILAVVPIEKIIIERILLRETVNHGLRIGRWDHFGRSSMEFETSRQNLHWLHFHDYYVLQDNAQS